MMDGLQRDGGVGYNDIGYHSKVQNSTLKWPTSNATTPYVVGYWNIEKEPVVVEIPAATPDVSVFGALMDAWQRPMADVGPSGSTVAEVRSTCSRLLNIAVLCRPASSSSSR